VNVERIVQAVCPGAIVCDAPQPNTYTVDYLGHRIEIDTTEAREHHCETAFVHLVARQLRAAADTARSCATCKHVTGTCPAQCAGRSHWEPR
jgi:hypothetical protein